MDHLAVALDSFPRQSDGQQSESKYDAELKAYVSMISQLPDSTHSALCVNPSPAFEVRMNYTSPQLPQLSLAKILHQNRNSLGFLTVLDILVGSKKELDQQVLSKIVEFLNDFDPVAVRYAGTAFRRLLENVISGSLFPVRRENMLHVVLLHFTDFMDTGHCSLEIGFQRPPPSRS